MNKISVYLKCVHVIFIKIKNLISGSFLFSLWSGKLLKHLYFNIWLPLWPWPLSSRPYFFACHHIMNNTFFLIYFCKTIPETSFHAVLMQNQYHDYGRKIWHWTLELGRTLFFCMARRHNVQNIQSNSYIQTGKTKLLILLFYVKRTVWSQNIALTVELHTMILRAT
jgi:hypothetical protein